MESYVAYADALTSLGHGQALWSALLEGQCGLVPAVHAFPGHPGLGRRYVGAIGALPAEQRLPGIFQFAADTIIPRQARSCDFIVGASSLGDLMGSCGGQPERALRGSLASLFPGIGDDRCLLVSSACSSGTDAMGIACLLIERRMADVVGVLAFDSLEAGKLLQHVALGTQSADRARPFDRERSGTSFGEGAAFVIIASRNGLRRIDMTPIVRVAGMGMSCDALDITAPDPTGRWPSMAIVRALASAGPAAARIGYVNAHGSGTPLNDRIEGMALRAAFGERIADILVSSTKGAVGHLLGATGLAELVFTTWSIRDGWCPGNVGLKTPDPDIPLSTPRDSIAPAGGLHAALSVTFGFGGVNSAIVLERA